MADDLHVEICARTKTNDFTEHATHTPSKMTEELEITQVTRAVKALFQIIEKQGKNDKAFLTEGEDILMQLTLKKVPDVSNKTIKIPLPTTLMRDSTDVCLFVKDMEKDERDFSPTVEHFKELLEKKNVTAVSDVIPIKMLKLEYQPIEAKRNLSNMYEYFLADERIVRLLPSLLGKNFYARKRLPIPVDLQMNNLKSEIEKALKGTRLILGGRGGSSQLTVAHTAMSEEQVVENVMAVYDRLKDTLPEGIMNLKRIHLRTQASPALPVFASQESVNDIIPTLRKRKVDNSEPEEISTLIDKKVKVSPDGDIKFFSMDGELLPSDDQPPTEVARKSPRSGKKGKKNAYSTMTKRVSNDSQALSSQKVTSKTANGLKELKKSPQPVKAVNRPTKGTKLKEKSKGKNGQVIGKSKAKKMKSK